MVKFVAYLSIKYKCAWLAPFSNSFYQFLNLSKKNTSNRISSQRSGLTTFSQSFSENSSKRIGCPINSNIITCPSEFNSKCIYSNWKWRISPMIFFSHFKRTSWQKVWSVIRPIRYTCNCYTHYHHQLLLLDRHVLLRMVNLKTSIRVFKLNQRIEFMRWKVMYKSPNAILYFCIY